MASEDQQNLKQLGLKVTKPRLKILEIFQHASKRHLTADDVYRRLIQSGQEVGIATVYRVLNQFETAGILKRVNFGSDQSVYELDEGYHHDHIVCVKCNRVREFYDETIEKRQNEVVRARGDRIVDHSLCIYVVCAECRAKK
jgi:Fur family ferric uptake transcriptional regulator